MEKTNDINKWKVKYYKGLGTSTSKEFKEYFKEKKTVELEYSEDKSKDAIDMAFNKKRANDRKEWLENYNKDNHIDTNKKSIKYEDFIERELIHFSKYDCERSIPNLMDGLKISQRKILYTAIKKYQTCNVHIDKAILK